MAKLTPTKGMLDGELERVGVIVGVKEGVKDIVGVMEGDKELEGGAGGVADADSVEEGEQAVRSTLPEAPVLASHCHVARLELT